MVERVEIGNAELYLGDCLDIMPDLEPVETCICDPPYGISFMGKDWDHGVPGPEYWNALNMKPGGLLLAFGGTRTFHRLTCAIEDAGYEIRDCINWLYGSGFPKSLDISKSIDKHYGAEREVVGIQRLGGNAGVSTSEKGGTYSVAKYLNETGVEIPITEPATPEAKKWDGWGTGLKPAWEPIIVAMKPLDQSFARNALTHDVAGLNVDGARISAAGYTKGGNNLSIAFGRNMDKQPRCDGSKGRYPSNVILDEESAQMLDEQSGNLTSGKLKGNYQGSTGDRCYGEYGYVDKNTESDSGGASRFFYCAKSSREERNAGCDGLESHDPRYGKNMSSSDKGTLSNSVERNQNNHPTVKPVALLKYLCILTMTPFGGTVTDPFMGSGSMGVAALAQGRKFIGIEKNPHDFRIACARIQFEADQLKMF